MKMLLCILDLFLEQITGSIDAIFQQIIVVMKLITSNNHWLLCGVTDDGYFIVESNKTNFAFGIVLFHIAKLRVNGGLYALQTRNVCLAEVTL